MEEISGLKRLCELAYNGLLKEDFQLEFTMSTTDDIQCLGLMKKTTKRYVDKGSIPSFSFLHLSIQEFLAAWYVSCNSDLVSSTMSEIFVSSGEKVSFDSSHQDINYSVFLQTQMSFDIQDFVKPHLHNFVFFLAGIKGAGLFSDFPLLYKLHCFYESQSTKDDVALGELEGVTEISLRSPMDMYVFGYALIHTPARWNVTVYSSCDMLVSCLDNYGTAGILGSITTLNIAADYLLPSLKINTSTQPDKAFDYTFLSKFASALQNLECLRLEVFEAYSNDHVLYQALHGISHLKKISLVFHHISSEGVLDLAILVANSSSLNTVSFQYGRELNAASSPLERLFPRYCSWHTAERLGFEKLLAACLSSSSLRELTIEGFPFRLNERDIPCFPGIQTVNLIVSRKCGGDNILQERLFDWFGYLCSITNVPSIELDLWMMFSVPPKLLCTFLALLNRSLADDHERSIKKLSMLYGVMRNTFLEPCDCKYLSCALRQDPVIPHRTIERSKSLCDLTRACPYFSTGSCSQKGTFADHHHSCPDLLELQSLCLLRDGLREGLAHRQGNKLPEPAAPWLSLSL